MECIDIVVIGAGQAGLVMSHFLQQQGREHVLLERARIGERWRSERWDSLQFQFPNRYVRLPGMPYDGDDPEGFMPAREVVQRIERYAALIKAPVVPQVSAQLPPSVVQVTANRYVNPAQFPPGAVLVVCTGASGAQIAEDLVDGGRQVYLSAGNHGRIPRRYRARDITDWLEALGPRYDPPRPVMLTSVRGGYDMDLRVLAQKGVMLAGRLEVVDGTRVRFAADLADRIAEADAFFDGMCNRLDTLIASRPDLSVDALPAERVSTDRSMPEAALELDLHETVVVAVIWATGYRNDLGWQPPAALDGSGDAIHERGVSNLPGLYFLGLHFQTSNRSQLFWGCAEDAEYLAAHMQAERCPRPNC